MSGERPALSQVEVSLPHSVHALCAKWSAELGCSPQEVLYSLLSCGLGYLLARFPQSAGFRRLVPPALADLAALAPPAVEVRWYTLDVEKGQISEE